VVVAEQKKLEDGMAGGVLAGAKVVKHKNILILSTNDVFEDWLLDKAIIESKKGKEGLIVGKAVERYFPGGYLKTEKGRLASIIEKPGEGKEPSKLVNMVLHIYNDFPASIVARLVQQTDKGWGSVAMLTGDAETEEEREILLSGQALDAQILKLGHHGSRTATSDGFLSAVGPKTVIVSAGQGNKFEHPHPETMEKVKYLKVRNTMAEGNVIIAP